MAKIIVFHFTEEGKLPPLNPEQIQGIINKKGEILKDYPDVHFNGTYVDENGRGICDWDAPDTAVVREIIIKLLGSPPTDGLIAVKRVL